MVCLQVNPEKRLGCGPGGIEEIKNHRWFQRIDWAMLIARRLPAPIVPRLQNLLDTSNFDNFDDADEEMAPPPVPPRSSGEKVQANWDMWEWVDSTPYSRV